MRSGSPTVWRQRSTGGGHLRVGRWSDGAREGGGHLRLPQVRRNLVGRAGHRGPYEAPSPLPGPFLAASLPARGVLRRRRSEVRVVGSAAAWAGPAAGCCGTRRPGLVGQGEGAVLDTVVAESGAVSRVSSRSSSASRIISTASVKARPAGLFAGMSSGRAVNARDTRRARASSWSRYSGPGARPWPREVPRCPAGRSHPRAGLPRPRWRRPSPGPCAPEGHGRASGTSARRALGSWRAAYEPSFSWKGMPGRGCHPA